ncbi:MAG: UTP--glucose-1-phosphate uridylyltransferase [Bryobacteraceae bacterium]|nr:UTP--glucose-1-phosphate uridylyltransferase [Bryobacteraceae bacterium]
MRITKAVITAAGRRQRTLPLQTLIDQDGLEKSVLRVIVEEVLRANVEEICVVVAPGDETAYEQVAGDHARRLRFVHQAEPRGYGHAVFCARGFTGGEPFLHLVGDHLYVSATGKGCAQRLVEVAQEEECAVSAVQRTRESQLAHYGVIGGHRMHGRQDLYRIETVIEKPTPTEAEERLIVPGLRAGHYLSFFGMHALTPTVMELLAAEVAAQDGPVALSGALARLPAREQYLALETPGWRYDVGVKYGLLTAQLAVALNGTDREEVLARLVELLALREMGNAEAQGRP